MIYNNNHCEYKTDCCISTQVEMQQTALYLKDCLYNLKEQMHMSVYKEFEIIYFTHTESLRLRSLSDVI